VLADSATGVMTDPNRLTRLEPAPMPAKRRVRLVLLGCGMLVLGAIVCVGSITVLSLNFGGRPSVVPIQGSAPKSVDPVMNPDFKRAEEFFNRALARNPKEFDAAIADLSEAIHLAEKPEYYANRGRRYILRGQENSDKADYDKAIVDFTEAIRLAPKMADYWNQRGWAYLNKEDWQKALADIEEAVQLAPSWATCYSNRGWAYKLKGDYAAALLDLNKAIELDPRHTPAIFLRGEIYFHRQEYDSAIANFTDAPRSSAIMSPLCTGGAMPT
jgi:cytochrome c-type biogenesis protein CcmH/NrfG